LVARPMYQEMLDSIGPQTNFIMLHARATTVGAAEDNFNNHPIITEPIIGIHNGTLLNEDGLFKRFEADFERDGDVDSEIIFKLYLHFVEQGLSPKQAMSQAGSMLDGAFTGALVDMRTPSQMVMFKNARSLCVFRFPHTDTVIAVSEARFYDRVARKLNIKARERCESLSDGTGMLFDLNIDQRITDEIIDFDIPVNKGFINRRSGWVSSVFGY
jgi:glucosamine 6-phosphate synthetase-like amidotransferase/phosphosugar isomerase protein